ncbi:MAG TPA: VOC family protein [Pseudonocardia sp.]|uniref:VOC family protein n=1 Tax=Pseudonocardia sp. TaxID=60912 RepID=UPI002C8378FA|nr:VOC family protein [Pseudonocardia sp.]HTF54704.1 VOC family protein [Pseudonocardia sp.]
MPNVTEAVEYYTQFGLIPLEPTPGDDNHWFGTVDGGRQLRIVESPVRKLQSVGIGVDDRDDLGRIASSLRRLGVASRVEGDQLMTIEPITGLEVTLSVTSRLKQEVTPTPAYNSPGNIVRANTRAWPMPGRRPEPVRPRRLGHVSIGSTDRPATMRFFTDGIGFKVSDDVGDLATFMRCSTDHHNVVVNAAPVNFLHHTSWEVDDVDEIGRGAQNLLAGHPERHVWGLGRHYVGSNFFYYFRDPAGNFTEYYSDMDEILDDQLWQPGVFELDVANSWSPEMSPSLIKPDDLAELMAGLH